MSCTKEEIERKRLAALQKRQSGQSKAGESNSAQNFSPARPVSSTSSYVNSVGQSNAGPMKSFNGNFNKGFHPYARPENNHSYNAGNQRTENVMPVTKVVTGSVYLISEDKFEVNPSEFCTPLINIFKTIPSKSYDSKSKLWNFSVSHHQDLMSKVAPLAPHIVLEPLPPFVLKILQEKFMDPNSIDLSPIEATLRHKLMPFQEDGVRFALSRRGRCMIADDMGLGKTFQALAIASYYRHNWPLLIVTTSTMRETWQSTIHELLPSIPLMNIATVSSGRDAQLVADRQTEVVIVSYKIISTHTELLKNKKFGVVIIDESHTVKSHKAQCTVSLSHVARNASRVVLLSGTPALSRPSELYTQLTLLQSQLLSYSQYGKRYCAGKLTKFGWDMSGQSNLAELQVLLQRKFLIRRTKEQVLTQLERKTRESVILDQSLLGFTKEEEQGLTQMAQAYKATKSNERHAALLNFFSESARVKIPAISKYIRQLLKEESTGKFLIFAHHRNMIDAICLTLDEAGVHYICITGATPSTSRADLVDKFQYTDSCRCAVLSITAANAGITLTAANLVLFAELHWNPGILTQAESRAHRIGQTGGVCVRYLLAHNTVDDFIWPMLQNKLNVLNDVGLSKDTFADTTTKHQESKNNITQYLSPSTFKNKNDYIPGTNIRKDSLKSNNESAKENCGHSSKDSSVCDLNGDMSITEEFEKSFLDDDEGDELLAKLDL